jgi:hypothetical protein
VWVVTRAVIVFIIGLGTLVAVIAVLFFVTVVTVVTVVFFVTVIIVFVFVAVTGVFFFVSRVFVTVIMLTVLIVVVVGNFFIVVVGLARQLMGFAAEFVIGQQAYKKAFHIRPYPEDGVGLLQGAALGRAQGVVVRAAARGDKVGNGNVIRGHGAHQKFQRLDGGDYVCFGGGWQGSGEC